MIRPILLSLCLLSVAMPPALAQTAPSTAPAARPRRAVTVPPGFQLIVDGNRNVLCQEGDAAWVRQVIADKTPTTRPSTMPADLLEKLTASRETLAARVTSDLALSDRSAAAKFVDDELIPLLTRAANFRPPVFYLVTSRDALREVVKNGWTDPAGRYHYNRAADQVSVPMDAQLPMDGDADDQVIAVVYDPGDDIPARNGFLKRLIADTEAKLNYVVTARAMYATQLQLVSFIARSALDPLKMERDDQQWFPIGVTGVLSAQYLALINGSPPDEFLLPMMRDDRRNPIRSATVNLLSPTSLSDMREGARAAYADAFRRKSTAVAKNWLDRVGPAGLAKVLAAARATPPADGAALAKLIADQTGIDLTQELLPR